MKNANPQNITLLDVSRTVAEFSRTKNSNHDYCDFPSFNGNNIDYTKCYLHLDCTSVPNYSNHRVCSSDSNAIESLRIIISTLSESFNHLLGRLDFDFGADSYRRAIICTRDYALDKFKTALEAVSYKYHNAQIYYHFFQDDLKCSGEKVSSSSYTSAADTLIYDIYLCASYMGTTKKLPEIGDLENQASASSYRLIAQEVAYLLDFYGTRKVKSAYSFTQCKTAGDLCKPFDMGMIPKECFGIFMEGMHLLYSSPQSISLEASGQVYSRGFSQDRFTTLTNVLGAIDNTLIIALRGASVTNSIWSKIFTINYQKYLCSVASSDRVSTFLTCANHMKVRLRESRLTIEFNELGMTRLDNNGFSYFSYFPLMYTGSCNMDMTPPRCTNILGGENYIIEPGNSPIGVSPEVFRTLYPLEENIVFSGLVQGLVRAGCKGQALDSNPNCAEIAQTESCMIDATPTSVFPSCMSLFFNQIYTVTLCSTSMCDIDSDASKTMMRYLDGSMNTALTASSLQFTGSTTVQMCTSSNYKLLYPGVFSSVWTAINTLGKQEIKARLYKRDNMPLTDEILVGTFDNIVDSAITSFIDKSQSNKWSVIIGWSVKATDIGSYLILEYFPITSTRGKPLLLLEAPIGPSGKFKLYTPSIKSATTSFISFIAYDNGSAGLPTFYIKKLVATQSGRVIESEIFF